MLTTGLIVYCGLKLSGLAGTAIGAGLAVLSPPMSPETLCGPINTMEDVETYDGGLGVSVEYVRSNEVSTVRFQWIDEVSIKERGYSPGSVGGIGWCTGTLIAPNKVLTAGHCFDAWADSTPFRFDSSGAVVTPKREELAQLQVINLNFQLDAATHTVREPRSFAVTKILEAPTGTGALDYAIVEIAPDASGQLPGMIAAPAEMDIREPSVGERIAAFQHPNGEPKKVEAGTVLNYDQPILYYSDLDTSGGSSGAGIFDDDGQLIGMHVSGFCEIHANEGLSLNAIAVASNEF
ncbi:trypsin-like serine peptidase [Ensifer adhaerens]|uniref:trypsin-like serine peptidase n=1 Tax=Ensifer adhaerens TaxID=106592 RepID=UPI00384F0122